jgi:hypothetical protein
VLSIPIPRCVLNSPAFKIFIIQGVGPVPNAGLNLLLRMARSFKHFYDITHFHLKLSIMNYRDYQKCIEACLQCAAACNHCASCCLQEKDVKMMVSCIQLDMECAAVCYNVAQLMSLGSHRANEFCSLCAEICTECADECGKHDNDHCRECANACHKCAEECMQMTEHV